MPIVAAMLDAERQRAFVAEELAGRYEEIDLLYAISEILGQTVRLEEATQIIAREVSTVVGARRASIMVFDEAAGVLRTVAARGFGLDGLAPVRVDDECSVAARVYRERRVVTYDPTHPESAPDECGEPRGYRGQAFLSVPICYGAPGLPLRCVGVINLTDRLGGDRFTLSDRKLVTAVANQIGAAVENARLVERDLGQQRLSRELELAHDLQLKLLPSPAVLMGDAEVAARCYPADSVGGDFYTFSRLGRGRVGVMLGDVASHGFSAALVMALVMSAAGIHAAAAVTPDETLIALLDSLSTELTTTEMYFSVFYGVLDPLTGRLSYANAGHPYAFRVPRFGDPERLEATAPPLGLATAGSIQRRQVPWTIHHDLLVLWTDGLVDARNEAGEPFGEQRLLDAVCARRTETPEAIVRAVLAEAEEFGSKPIDDRTLLILRI
jgi:sigma-B regulation protein RsbU (phosphoserine phosphatase)